MSLSLRASITICAPRARLFELISTPERLPEWNVSVEQARRVDPGHVICLGSRAIFSGRLFGQPMESETEVVDFEPPHLFGTRAIRGPRLTTRFLLEAMADRTRVQIDVSGEVPGGALGTVLAEGYLRRALTASLDRLRAIGESHQ